jgi:hypothetical protein
VARSQPAQPDGKQVERSECNRLVVAGGALGQIASEIVSVGCGRDERF